MPKSYLKNIFTASLLIFLLTAPIISMAAGGLLDPPPASNSIRLDSIITIFEKILDIVWGVFVAVSIMMFLWAAFMFLTAQGDSTQIGNARKAVIWGVVGLAVAFFAFSIVTIVKTVLGL